MNKINIKIICLLLFASFIVRHSTCFAETGEAGGHDYIDISNPFIRKIPIAILSFKNVSGTIAETDQSLKTSKLLSETLEFTGYFKMIDSGAFLVNSKEAGITAQNINFRKWTDIGSELLITGGFFLKDDVIEMELRLFDTFKERLLIGKRYHGLADDKRKIIRLFCSEVIYQLTGNRGIFNSKIAFVSTSTGNKEIYMCDFDGYNAKQLTHTKSITLSPAWSSDGKWIAYTSYAKGKPDLYIRHIKEKHGALVDKQGINISPAWVPGQFALAATLSFSGDPEIYLLTGTGKVIKNLTRNWGIDVSPAWSPDGKNMAFVSKRSGTPQIHIMDMDSGHVKRLTFEGRYNTSPSWSPKGDRIAFAAMNNGAFNIKVIGIDGNGLVQLTHGAGDNESPSWAPDGTIIAFSSTREGVYRIYVMTADGTDQRRLLSLPGEQTSPKWSLGIVNNK